MAFSIASYNVLANSYVRPEWYPHSTEVLNWSWRKPALIETVAGLGCGLICLQEVEPGLFAALEDRLGQLGYAGRYLRKGQGKPDGCATFFRQDLFSLEAKHAWHYHDNGRGQDSGHVLLVLQLCASGRKLALANTHLKWDPPATPKEQQWATRQIAELLRHRDSLDVDPAAWIVCGDFNVTPDSNAVRDLLAADFADVFADHPAAFTCNSNHRAKRIDYVFVGGRFEGVPEPMPAIDDDTPLPSPTQPSDHLPIRAACRWRDSLTKEPSCP